MNEVVEAFEYLAEIDGMDVPAEFNESDLEGFCKVLGKRNLRSLKVSLKDLRMNQKIRIF